MLISNSDNHIVQTERKIEFQEEGGYHSGNISIYGKFLGRVNLSLELYQKSTNTLLTQASVNVRVIRGHGALNTAFTVSVAVLVSLIYINFGSALNWTDFIKYLKKPIGPAIGFVGQFVFMPLLSYGVGYALFPDDPAMQLGFFFTGSSPGGGGSNIWTALLDGNIDLSITMTGISTLAAFGMIPFWIFTLGATIFDRSNLEVPYRNITMFAVALVIPLAIGYLIQRYMQKTANFLRKTLKIFSGILIIFIIVFAIVANLYLFEMFSWQIVVAGIGVPWLGYLGGWLLAKIFRQNPKDSLTIAIEVGLQNTGIAIFLLRFSLPQPEADLTTIAPVAVACMTPIPLLVLFLIKLVKRRIQMKNKPKDLGTVNEISVDSKVVQTQKY
ncbi:solute carrier family 10 member 6 isoform X2 [Agrilus planipennis]|nr:solute carrier family 10 member 6 isoform X2 [Agrilus planipennis]